MYVTIHPLVTRSHLQAKTLLRLKRLKISFFLSWFFLCFFRFFSWRLCVCLDLVSEMFHDSGWTGSAVDEDESQAALRMIHPEAEENVGSGALAHANHVGNFQSVDDFHQSVAHRTHARELETINSMVAEILNKWINKKWEKKEGKKERKKERREIIRSQIAFLTWAIYQLSS